MRQGQFPPAGLADLLRYMDAESLMDYPNSPRGPHEPFDPDFVIQVHPETSQPVQAFRPGRQQLRSRKKLALGLFVVTCLSTWYAGTLLGSREDAVVNGFHYSLSLMALLLAHEMGHYLQAKRYRIPATLPYFIPMPISYFGTMGAVILQGAGVADRKQLYDIAISGPLAGLLLTIPITWYGLQHASVVEIDPNAPGMLFGDPLIMQWMAESIHGPLAANQQVMLNPMLFAGWVGIFITALNLVPIGQLDGGHILYALIGRNAHRVAHMLLLGTVAYMFLSNNYTYMVMIILLLFMGPKHPPTANDRAPLGPVRVALGWLTLAFVVIGLTPTPLIVLGDPHRAPEPPPQKQQFETDLVVQSSADVTIDDSANLVQSPAASSALVPPVRGVRPCPIASTVDSSSRTQPSRDRLPA